MLAVNKLTLENACTFKGTKGENALFHAPNRDAGDDKFFDEVLRLIKTGNPQQLEANNVEGLLLCWIKIGNTHPFDRIMGRESDQNSPLRVELIRQMSEDKFEDKRRNHLHIIADEIHLDDSTSHDIAKYLVRAYNNKNANEAKANQPPWCEKDTEGMTPLGLAIQKKKDKLAGLFFKNDFDMKESFDGKNRDYNLFYAIDHDCPELAVLILESILDKSNKDDPLLYNHPEDGLNALHYAWKCTGGYLRVLLERLEFDSWRGQGEGVNITVIHTWIRNTDNPLLFVYAIKHECFSRHIISCMKVVDSTGKNPLHWAAEYGREDTVMDIMDILIHFISESSPPHGKEVLRNALREMDSEQNTPIHRAITAKREELIIKTFLPIIQETDLTTNQDILLKSVEGNLQKVVRYILDSVPEMYNINILQKFQQGQNILHLMTSSTWSEKAEQNCIFIAKRFPDLINEKDKGRRTPLYTAAEAGWTNLVRWILNKDSSYMQKVPSPWMIACENSHLPTLRTFIEHKDFSSICNVMKDSPLHHLDRLTYQQYKELLDQYPIMKEFMNQQNVKLRTPLHLAIENKDINLAKALLVSNVDRNIPDRNNTTAAKLLKKMCKKNPEWEDMCTESGVDPYYTPSYMQWNTNHTEMRNVISLVAALLATITFTAGFTVPGGLDDKGVANLAKNAAFLVFVIANTLAMCCSMLILFCIIWSLISKFDNDSAAFIDSSLKLLQISLLGTLVAFMCGVYLVIHSKSLLAGMAAIFTIIVCSLVEVVVLVGKDTALKLLKCLPSTEGLPIWSLLKLNFMASRDQQRNIQDPAPEESTQGSLSSGSYIVAIPEARPGTSALRGNPLSDAADPRGDGGSQDPRVP